jgi:uncharacterized protein YkwD
MDNSGSSNPPCYRIAAAALAILALAPETSARTPTSDACPSRHQIVGELVRGINGIRAEPRRCGAAHYPAAPELTWNERLFRIARQHAADMARRHYFSHNTPEGLTPGQRADIGGYDWRSYYENIGRGHSSVEEVLNDWLSSPTHCQAMMDKELRDVALACAAAGGELLWVLDLGAPRSGWLPGR